MKLNKSTEQSVYIVIILALQKNHKPLKSSLLATLLQVSDSYLKKVLRKLVVGGVITSAASKDGGFQLARSIVEISLGDVYAAVQGGDSKIDFLHIGNRLFAEADHVAEGERRIATALAAADDAMLAELRTVSLATILHDYLIPNGAIDWQQAAAGEVGSD